MSDGTDARVAALIRGDVQLAFTLHVIFARAIQVNAATATLQILEPVAFDQNSILGARVLKWIRVDQGETMPVLRAEGKDYRADDICGGENIRSDVVRGPIPRGVKEQGRRFETKKKGGQDDH